MASNLTQHITSHYFEAANHLGSKNDPRRIVAYVESYDDVFFWRTVLRRFENDERYFEIMLPQKSGKIARGKHSAMQSILRHTGADMIACVDADYDYLMQGHTQSSKMLLGSQHIFHTHAYAIENMQCYAPGLHDVCVMATLNDRRVFDFKKFFDDSSKTIYPLFLWSVWCYRNEQYNRMTISAMDMIITPPRLNPDNVSMSLQRVGHKVNTTVDTLSKEFPHGVKAIPLLAEELKTLGVDDTNVYMYVHGHNLLDRVVMPLLNSVCRKLHDMREREIRRQAIHHAQMNNELSCYTHSVEDILSMLKKNTAYTESSQFLHIVSRISDVLDKKNESA